MVAASAPGKIILFGEHAVVYGQPALAVPVTQVQATATIQESQAGVIQVEAPGIGLFSPLSKLDPTQPLAVTIRSVFSELGITEYPSCTIRITSTIPVASGLGSGAAVSVALIRALSAYLGKALPEEQVSTMAFNVEKLYHGTPSGIDNAVIAHARPVYFRKGQPIELLQVVAPFVIVIGDTGISALTRESVGDVRRSWEKDRARWEEFFHRAGDIARQAHARILDGDWVALGPLMDANHELLQAMTVSCDELDQLVLAARHAGAYGAKMSGGGRGGNMIALVDEGNAQAVARALISAGARRTIITQVG